ncbi:RCC1 domain-containing protein [Candidatus Riflebacteria bacterium]
MLHSLALKSDGTVVAWGNNDFYQLGDGEGVDYDQEFPVPVVDLTDVTAVSAGAGHSLALKSDGTVWGWGYNDSGQVGNGDDDAEIVEEPDQVLLAGGGEVSSSIRAQIEEVPFTGVIAISGGGLHSLALKSDGTVWAWGFDQLGQLGDGDDDNDSEYNPVQAGAPTTTSTSTSTTTASSQALTDVVAISAGFGHSMALKSDGTVWVWGVNNFYGLDVQGVLGLGEDAENVVYSPVQVPGLSNVVAIYAGLRSSYVLKDDGTVWGWGDNSSNQLGYLGAGEQPDIVFSPVQLRKENEDETISYITDIVSIAVGYSHAIFVKEDETYTILGELDVPMEIIDSFFD